jgi:hypothetical protein
MMLGLMNNKDDEKGRSMSSSIKKLRALAKKKRFDSIFDVDHEKVKTWTLTKDSASMGFAVYLKKEYNGGFDLSPDQ